ncbi:MAG: phosphatase PAP2 family protein [Chitinophagaceae bacterium]
MKFLDLILKFDLELFHKINGVWINGFLDILFPFLRESIMWIPLYFFLLLFSCINFGMRGVYWCVAFICTAALGDIISSHIIKELIYRARPCQNLSLGESVRLMVVYCPQSSSFVSSHATTHFSIAIFIFITGKQIFSNWIGIFLVWAAAISYAQVYVGVHFPLDVFCGTLIGCGIGTLSGWLYNRYIGISATPLSNQ